MATTAAPRGPDAAAVALAEHGYTPAELAAFTAHEDHILARAAKDALDAQLVVRTRLKALAGAPTQDREAEGGLVRTFARPIAMEVRGG